jgi:hypothetical protein
MESIEERLAKLNIKSTILPLILDDLSDEEKVTLIERFYQDQDQDESNEAVIEAIKDNYIYLLKLFVEMGFPPKEEYFVLALNKEEIFNLLGNYAVYLGFTFRFHDAYFYPKILESLESGVTQIYSRINDLYLRTTRKPYSSGVLQKDAVIISKLIFLKPTLAKVHIYLAKVDTLKYHVAAYFFAEESLEEYKKVLNFLKIREDEEYENLEYFPITREEKIDYLLSKGMNPQYILYVLIGILFDNLKFFQYFKTNLTSERLFELIDYLLANTTASMEEIVPWTPGKNKRKELEKLYLRGLDPIITLEFSSRNKFDELTRQIDKEYPGINYLDFDAAKKHGEFIPETWI